MQSYRIGKPGIDDNRTWEDVKPLLTEEQVRLVEEQQREAGYDPGEEVGRNA